jgi:tryptophanyl-tRNA synthetase
MSDCPLVGRLWFHVSLKLFWQTRMPAFAKLFVLSARDTCIKWASRMYQYSNVTIRDAKCDVLLHGEPSFRYGRLIRDDVLEHTKVVRVAVSTSKLGDANVDSAGGGAGWGVFGQASYLIHNRVSKHHCYNSTASADPTV